MFYSQLEQLCLHKSITMSALLTELNISKSAIQRWKTGGLPNSQTAKKIAAYFNVSTDYLLYGKEHNPETKESIDEEDNLDRILLERSTTPLPDDQKRILMKLIDSTIDTFLIAYKEEHKNH